ncbi:MAG: aminotransferase class I/II-fold pyridoxal phosphate-dependent enzyme, partial [Alicyclobacillus mali]|uniref:aminotransferase class I/II-fold pyridoxal phosphate-dependent enzyme n=1 Tax=Alicyclobacillus mali (ex Roth et al. 2021) TaxID=1123961 RepID=UPI0023F00D58
VIDRVAEVKEQIDFGASVISQVVAAKLLTSGVWEKQVDKLLVTLRQRRDAMVRYLQEHVGDKLEFSIPHGGYHLWARLKKPVPDTVLVDGMICHGVLVMPGRIYGSDPGYIRLTFAASTSEQIQEGIQRLGHALGDILSKTVPQGSRE